MKNEHYYEILDKSGKKIMETCNAFITNKYKELGYLIIYRRSN